MKQSSGSLALASVLACTLIAVTQAREAPESIAGDWYGSPEEAGELRTVAVCISEDAPGEFAGRLSFFDASIFNVPLVAAYEDGVLSFEFEPSRLRFEGDWQPENERWLGTLTEPGKPERPLELSEDLCGLRGRGIGNPFRPDRGTDADRLADSRRRVVVSKDAGIRAC